MAAAGTAHASLINGGFETGTGTPFVADANWALFNESAVPGWETTATDNQIEIWGNNFSSVSGGPVPAYEGRQFAEINATQFATLYQDVFGIATGSVVGFEFAHRGRSGVDTMRMMITDLGLDNLLGGGDDTVLFSKNYSTGNTAWAFYTSAGEAPISALGNATRFSYQAISTANGSPSVGNFIDAADFGVGVQAVPEPASIALIALGLAGLGLRRKRA
ncbi:MAG TPA: PEP-CTERM sorting domain-containing protein [Thauera aminoaromatica]|nr:PEP-CTERM sorting domain-containing protein [Thauera aminoaromatica]